MLNIRLIIPQFLRHPRFDRTLLLLNLSDRSTTGRMTTPKDRPGMGSIEVNTSVQCCCR